VDSLLARLKATNIKHSQLKNSDFIEIEAEVEGESIRMAKCYGFRNIQRVIQQIKKKKCSYSYVEIMACPGGCYSGGGQPKFPEMKPKDISE
jgi:iron only hydrogenase large subunit-like protein